MSSKLLNVIKGILVFLAFMLMSPVYAQDIHTTNAIIAVVNDDVITLRDLRQYIASIAGQLKIENKSPDEIQQIMQEYEQKGLDKLIEDKLILAAANDKGLDVRPELVDKRLEEIKGRYSSEDDFINALNVQGMTVSDLKQSLLDQMKVKYEVDMEVRDKIFVNPEDVTNYYNAHTSDFDRKPRVNLQSIFVSFDKYNKEAARNRAAEARSRLMAGQDFDTVAKQYSDGDSIGEVERGQMSDAVEKVIFSLGLNEVSDPLEVENGIYIFKAIGISPGKQQALAEVKDEIYNKLLDDQFQAKFKAWVGQLRDKAYVEIKQ